MPFFEGAARKINSRTNESYFACPWIGTTRKAKMENREREREFSIQIKLGQTDDEDDEDGDGNNRVKSS